MRESPITRMPGSWADRHPVATSLLLLAALAVMIVGVSIR